METFKKLFPVCSYWVGKKLQILSTLFYRNNPIKWSKKTYERKFNVSLNLDEPKAFYEKMNYWKHFAYRKEQDALTDKLLVKSVLEDNGYGYLCAKCYFSTDSIKELKKWISENKDKYKKFVLKTSHSCGDVFIYNNGEIVRKGGRKIKSLNQVLKMLKIGLGFNQYYVRFEENYRYLKPMVFVEEYIDIDNDTTEYEFMCNYGKIIFTNVVTNRQKTVRQESIVDDDFKLILNHFNGKPNSDLINIEKPREYELMKAFISEFVSGFPFCRVDFIETKDKVYFCEFTFVKSGGMNIYKPADLNMRLGTMFKL